MQAAEAARASSQEGAPAGQDDAGAAPEPALSATTEVPQPLFTGEAQVLWTTAISFLVIFFFVILLIMWMNARSAIRQGRGRPPGDFFQPAGEGAEITFDDEDAVTPEPPSHPTLAAATKKPREKTQEKPEKKRKAGGLFGGRRSENVAEAVDETLAAPAETPAAPRAHPLAPERRLHADVVPLRGAAADLSGDLAERNSGAPANAVRFGEDEAARARRQVEEEFRRIEEERRAATERNDEFERRKQMAALDHDRRTFEAREQAIADKAGALERQIGELRRDLADELDARFDALSRQFGDQLARLAAERATPAANENSGAAVLREIETRLAVLSQEFDQKLAAGASNEQVSAIAGLVARRIGEESDALNAAVATISKRMDGLAAKLQDYETLRGEMAALRRAVPAAGAGAGAPTIQLSDILRDALPPGAFDMRVLLSNNRRADCIVKLPYPPGPIAVDAQFPVDAFSQGEIAPHAENELRRTALRHIADVAERLIAPGETADSALMFIPSEAVYSLLHMRFPDVIQDSYRAHVWIVSPTTLMAALHTMRAVLRDAPREADARIDAATPEFNALAARVSALEAAVPAAAIVAPASEETAPGAVDEFSAEAEPSERWRGGDSSKGDLWDDDQSAGGSTLPFPLR